MTDEPLIALALAHDELDRAVQSILVAQPFQMTHAAERLTLASVELRDAVQKMIRAKVQS